MEEIYLKIIEIGKGLSDDDPKVREKKFDKFRQILVNVDLLKFFEEKEVNQEEIKRCRFNVFESVKTLINEIYNETLDCKYDFPEEFFDEFSKEMGTFIIEYFQDNTYNFIRWSNIKSICYSIFEKIDKEQKKRYGFFK